MLPPFRIVDRQRPMRIVQEPAQTTAHWPAGGPGGDLEWSAQAPAAAPYVAVEIGLDQADGAADGATDGATEGATSGSPGRVVVGWRSAGGVGLHGWADLGSRHVGLEVTDRAGVVRTLRSRRLGRLSRRPARLALTVTGNALTLLVADAEHATWTARARFDVPTALLDLRDERVPAGLTLTLRAPADAGVRWLRAGAFGQLGLRDLHVATTPEGDVVRHDDGVLMAATSAGPGFFPTAHTSLWRFDPASGRLDHLSDVFFRRRPTPALRAARTRRGAGHRTFSRSGPGVYGDHGTQVIRAPDGWLVLTSSWGDFTHQGVRILTARTDADLTRGTHVLDATPLPLPTHDLGAWDPHLMRLTGTRDEQDEEDWVLAYVAAQRFFDHHPVLARGPAPDRLRSVGADLRRHATEGVVLVRVAEGADPVLLASDGRPVGRSRRERLGPPPGFPVFDLALRQIGRLTAPYPTNLPWPNVWREGDDWWLVTFNGARAGGSLTGYGTHGDVVVMRAGQKESEEPDQPVDGRRTRDQSSQIKRAPDGRDPFDVSDT